MRNVGPVTQIDPCAAPGNRPGLRTCFILMVSAGLICATAMGAPASKAGTDEKSATAQTKDAAPGDFVGAETCATCHEEVAKGFASNPHNKIRHHLRGLPRGRSRAR
jgi:cytochrome c5